MEVDDEGDVGGDAFHELVASFLLHDLLEEEDDSFLGEIDDHLFAWASTYTPPADGKSFSSLQVPEFIPDIDRARERSRLQLGFEHGHHYGTDEDIAKWLEDQTLAFNNLDAAFHQVIDLM